MNFTQFASTTTTTTGKQREREDRDLTAAEQEHLQDIRRRKAELLKEISQLQSEIDNVTREMEFKQPSTTCHHPPGGINDFMDGPPGQLQEDQKSIGAGSGGGFGETTSLGGGSNKQDNISVNSQTLSSNLDNNKLMSLGCKKFNMDSKKGLEYLIDNGLVKKDADDVAQFLYRGEGLNKTAIGEFLGERNPFNEGVLKSFVSLHDFTDLILVQALRQFLWSFRLPGEAQKIDRMMIQFAERYCHCNPDIFNDASSDTCYILSFAIIMLNTSLHNPSVKEKPTVENFIAMNRGINNGGDLPRELLISLYSSIQSEPFKIPSEDDGYDLMGHTFFNPDKEGWLWKQGGRYKTWKRRWFILNDNCLYYFEFTTDKEPRGIIPLENVAVRATTAGENVKGRFCFEIFSQTNSIIKACKTLERGKVVEGKHTVYRMSAGAAEERDDWIKCLEQSIKHTPFLDLINRKLRVLKKDL